MSYPKNAATPPRVAVGPVVQISDGAVQTSGVSIRVVPQGGAAAAGLGTTSYEDGVVLYAPTQAETNYDAFVVIAYKTGCIPATTTVVTSDTATAGRVRLSGETHSGATIPTVTTITNAVTAGTVSDKTGFKLASDGLAAISAWSVTITGNLTGNVTGSVNSVTSTVSANVTQWNSGSLPTFPTNFGSLLINSSGHVSRVTLVDTTTTNTDMRGTDGAALASVWTATVAGRIDMPLSDIPTAGENADAVWDEAMAGHTTAGTYGGRIPRSDSSNVEVKLTGSAHIAADIHELQPAVIEAQHFDLGAIDANALAADAASEIASAVRTNLATELGRIDVASSTLASQSSVNTLTAYVDTEVAAIKAKTDALPANPAATSDIPSAITIADAVLSRSVANVEGSAAEHTLCTLVLAALEGAISGSTWTIKRSNGSTTHYTKTVTADANASPIVGVQ